MAKTQNKAKVLIARVAQNRSVEVDGKLLGPGEVVDLPSDELESLHAKGFLADPVDDTSGVSDEEHQE